MLVAIQWIAKQLLWSAYLMPAVHGKVVRDKTRMRVNYLELSKWSPGEKIIMDGLHYVSHFGCDVGRCSYSIKARISGLENYTKRALNWNQYIWDAEKFSILSDAYQNFKSADMMTVPNVDTKANLELRIILDSEWEEKALTKSKFTPRVAGSECMGDIQSRASREVQIPLNGDWSKIVSGNLSQKARPHHWYFVLEDCAGNIVHKFSQQFGVKPNVFLPNLQIEYEMTFTNSDGSHVGVEYKNMSRLQKLGIIVSMAAGFWFFTKQTEILKKKSSVEGVHPVVIAVNVALVCYMLHLILAWYHLQACEAGYEGHPAWDAFGTVVCVFSNMILVLLIFAVGLGYSLNVGSMTIPGEALLAMALCYTFIESVLTFAQYKTYSVRYHLHMSQGVIPTILGIFRILLAVGFYFSVNGTLARDDILNPQVEVFLNKFKWRGIGFISFSSAVLLIVSLFVPSYNQLRYNFVAKLAIELGMIVYLGVAFLSKNTSFHGASSIGSTELPSPGGFANQRYSVSPQGNTGLTGFTIPGLANRKKI